MSENRGASSQRNDLGWNTRAEVPALPTGQWGTPHTIGDGLLQKLARCVGVAGSEIARSDSDPQLVQANDLIGNPREGKRNAWVFQQLSGRESPEDRINAVAALTWMGYGAWTNYEQDEADRHWTAARRLLTSEFKGFETQAEALRSVLDSLPS